METKLREFKKEDIIDLLENIGNNLEGDITIFMIGGGNMCLKDIKAVTQDVDWVVLTKEEHDNLSKVLNGFGYECHEENLSDEFYKTPIIVFLKRKEKRRIDVFIKNVSNQLELSKSMEKRSERYSKFNKLKVMLVSNEDLFLFKSITDREKDVDDCNSLINIGINWKIIKKELENQEGKALWRFWIYEQSCRIRNKFGKLVIPDNFFDYVKGLVKEKWKKRPEDFMEGIEDEG